MNYSKPKLITVYGGDTFYNHANIRQAYTYACSVPSVIKVQSVSEIQKLEKDFDIRSEMISLCRSNNKTCGVEFSLDLEGPKSGDFVSLLNQFATYNNLESINFSCVLTIDQILDDNLGQKIAKYLKTYDALTFFGNLSLNLDYNAVTTKKATYETMLKKTEELFNALYVCRDVNLSGGLRPKLLYKHGCLARSAQSLVKYDGMLSTCGKVKPEFDIIPVSAVNMSKEFYSKFLESKQEFKKIVTYPICEACEAKPICGRCPKFINEAPIFDGTSDTCMFYKALFEIVKSRNILI